MPYSQRELYDLNKVNDNIKKLAFSIKHIEFSANKKAQISAGLWCILPTTDCFTCSNRESSQMCAGIYLLKRSKNVCEPQNNTIRALQKTASVQMACFR